MKLPLLCTALVAVLGLALSGTAASAQTNTMAAPATSPAPSTKMTKTPYKGSITAIDASGGSITIQAASGPMTLKIDATTKYKGGKSLADFAVGDVVTGSYTKGDDGTLTAASVHKKKAPAAPAAQ
jgi:hypothetical protein